MPVMSHMCQHPSPELLAASTIPRCRRFFRHPHPEMLAGSKVSKMSKMFPAPASRHASRLAAPFIH
eukprot:10367714-Lingulodinium_polyedra.AAC.1